ncbi:hypothetical protein [Pedobacter sp. Leaf250]|uniref:hypothetical protein n=1 Tax=Pedobacter sp. Leaf250 TaxID=2876559 RepID=UPI001E28D8AC|nr:hypothetical protein [Pedobacter sp. Leaf250]
MKANLLFQALNSIHQTSYGLQAYLQVALETLELPKNYQLGDDHHQRYPLCFIVDGFLKTTLESKIEPGIRTLLFHSNQSFLAQFAPLDVNDYSMVTIAIVPTTLLVIPEKHLYPIHQFFPEFHTIISKLYQIQMSNILFQVFSRQHHSATHRLNDLLLEQKDIFQMTSVSDVAGFLGIHPNSLSALKNK